MLLKWASVGELLMLNLAKIPDDNTKTAYRDTKKSWLSFIIKRLKKFLNGTACHHS